MRARNSMKNPTKRSLEASPPSSFNSTLSLLAFILVLLCTYFESINAHNEANAVYGGKSLDIEPQSRVALKAYYVDEQSQEQHGQELEQGDTSEGGYAEASAHQNSGRIPRAEDSTSSSSDIKPALVIVLNEVDADVTTSAVSTDSQLPINSNTVTYQDGLFISKRQKSNINLKTLTSGSTDSQLALSFLYTFALTGIALVYITVIGLDWALSAIEIPPVQQMKGQMSVVIIPNDQGPDVDEATLTLQLKFVKWFGHAEDDDFDADGFSLDRQGIGLNSKFNASRDVLNRRAEAQAVDKLCDVLDGNLDASRKGKQSKFKDPETNVSQLSRGQGTNGSGFTYSRYGMRSNTYECTEPAACIRTPAPLTIGVPGVDVLSAMG